LILLGELEEYDGKSVTILGEIAHRWSREPCYPEALLELFGKDDPVVQNGASWLFKSFVETGNPVEIDVSAKLTEQAGLLSDWAALLHICQSVQHLSFAPAEARNLGELVFVLLDHDRPFLRAWSLDALVRLSSFDPALHLKAREALARALLDSAASVRARAKKLEVSGDD